MTEFLTLLFTTSGGLLLTVFLFKGGNFIDVQKKGKEAEELVNSSKEEAKQILEESKKRFEVYSKNVEEDLFRKSERIEKKKESITFKEETVNKKELKVNDLKLIIASEEESFQSVQSKIKRSDKDVFEKLSQKTGQNKEVVFDKIINDFKRELEESYTERARYMEEEMKESAVSEAKRIIVSSLQRLSSATSVETRAIHVRIPKDSVKGKIVGDGAKNIIHLETSLDIAVVFNDLPNTVSVSAFNLVSRRIGQRTLEKLVEEKGAITIDMINKYIDKSRKEVDEELYEIGKKAVGIMGFDWQDKDLLRVIGRLKYRTSYGQNIMKHSMEVSWMSMMLASEIGLDVETAKVAGFLHDIGKAIDQDPEVQDAHDFLTKEIMEKHKFSWAEVHAAWVHHDSEPQQTAEAFLIKAADSISASRPGARAESIYSYSERLEALNNVVSSFSGINKYFAMSAGREVRVYVRPNEIKDGVMETFASDIAKKIEEDVVYPGKIKVNLIRRVEHTEIAKAKI